MPIIKGRYKFKDVLTPFRNVYINDDRFYTLTANAGENTRVNFTYGGVAFHSMHIITTSEAVGVDDAGNIIGYNRERIYFDTPFTATNKFGKRYIIGTLYISPAGDGNMYESPVWYPLDQFDGDIAVTADNPGYELVVLGDGLELTDEGYAWFIDNTEQLPITISLTDPNGVTLATKETYCETDIQITPILEELSITPSAEEQTATPSEGYAGIAKVTVLPGEQPQLYSPTATLDGDTLTIEDASNGAHAAAYDIYVDGVKKTTVSNS